MKKVLVSLLVVGLLSVSASAGIVQFQATKVNNTTYTISVVANAGVLVTGITFDAIMSDHAGTAASPVMNTTLAGGAGVSLGTVDNIGNLLIDTVGAASTTAATGVLYSFTYTVPNVAPNTQITIYADSSNGNMNEVDGVASGAGFAVAADPVTIVTPEPMTLALLGLGGLFLRRRK